MNTTNEKNASREEAIKSSYTAKDIYADDDLYCFLLSYYYPDLQEPDIEAAIRSSSDMRRTICEYMAAWLPWDKHYTALTEMIEK